MQQAFHHSTTVDLYGWHYPSPYLIIASALATMPYLVALVVWQAATLAPFTIMAQRYLGRRDGWLYVIAAPVTLICLPMDTTAFSPGCCSEVG